MFARDAAGALRFHPTPELTTLDVEEVLATVEPLVARRLQRLGLGHEDGEMDAPDTWADEAPVLAGLAAASIQGTVALGSRRGARLRRLGDETEPVQTPDPGDCHARANGFDLHAGVVVPAGQRERLERVVRYVLRPPVAQERLHLTGDGQVRLDLRHPWRDGTTGVVFDPVESLGPLAVLVPRPRVNLLLYHGVLGARSAWRAEVVPHQPPIDVVEASVPQPETPPPREAVEAKSAPRRAPGPRWSSMMARTFGFDVLACGRCGGRLRLIALIEEAAVIGRILRHLGLPTEIPAPRPARADGVLGAPAHQIGTRFRLTPVRSLPLPSGRRGADANARRVSGRLGQAGATSDSGPYVYFRDMFAS